MGSAIAASPTMITARAPASTINPRTSWNWFPNTLQITSAAMITLVTMIALTGEWVRSLTLARLSGMSRSNDHAKKDLIGMNVFAIIDGNDQNRNEPMMMTVRIGVLNTRD